MIVWLRVHVCTHVQTYWVALTLCILTLITALSLSPMEHLPAVPGTDKTHHLIAYAVLMFPAALRRPRYVLLCAVFFIAWSGAIELIQPSVNRYGEWLDMAANTGGVLCGWACGLLMASVCNRVDRRGELLP